MSDKIIQMAEQLVNRQNTRIPAMSVSEFSDLMLYIRCLAPSPKTTLRLSRIAQRKAMYRCRMALSA